MTIVEWLPIFTNPEIVTIILDSLRFVQKERDLILYAWVIMENHLHLIVMAPNPVKTMKEFKSYTARTIIDYLRDRGSKTWLNKLQEAKLSHKTTSNYQVWQEGSHPQEIVDEEMMVQKIEYIHNNPVRRGYIDEPEYWRYSSARNYEGLTGLLKVETEWYNV